MQTGSGISRGRLLHFGTAVIEFCVTIQSEMPEVDIFFQRISEFVLNCCINDLEGLKGKNVLLSLALIYPLLMEVVSLLNIALFNCCFRFFAWTIQTTF